MTAAGILGKAFSSVRKSAMRMASCQSITIMSGSSRRTALAACRQSFASLNRARRSMCRKSAFRPSRRSASELTMVNFMRASLLYEFGAMPASGRAICG
jgi:hypothetical protein